jgi:hypothetical protein
MNDCKFSSILFIKVLLVCWYSISATVFAHKHKPLADTISGPKKTAVLHKVSPSDSGLWNIVGSEVIAQADTDANSDKQGHGVKQERPILRFKPQQRDLKPLSDRGDKRVKAVGSEGGILREDLGSRPGANLRHYQRMGQRYRLYLATMGTGHWLFTYFGHNAIRIHDRQRGTDINYNFGTFSIDPSIAGIWKMLREYLQFSMQYWLSEERYHWSLSRYRHEDRTYWLRELFLTEAEAERLVGHLREHALPQNRNYPYHHYTNNCSTKLRDALALALGKEFLHQAQVKRGQTYRKLVLERMKDNPIVMIGMDFGMGPPADRELTWAEEMFLPEKLDEYVAAAFWQQHRDRALANSETIVYRRQHPPAWWPISPTSFVYLWALCWALLGLALWRSRFFRWWMRLLLLKMSILGFALALMMFGSKFPEPPGNANILFFHPLHLLAWWWLSKRRWPKISSRLRSAVRTYLYLHLAVGLVYLLLKAIGIAPHQVNLHYVIFAMASLGLAAAKLRSDPTWGGVESKSS